jgi:integrase
MRYVRRGYGPHTVPVPQQIYDLVKRRPRTARELIAEIWWIHPQDAPKLRSIKAHIHLLNRRLRGRGEQIKSTRGAHCEMPYRLVTAP